MNKKKVLFWVLIPLISALLIAGIVIGSVMSCAPKSGGPNTPVEPGPDDPPVDDPPVVDPPPHEHQWMWTYTPTEHYQYCGADSEIRNKGPHEYANEEETVCKYCGYVRKLPTKQEDMEVEFDEDGNAKIGGATGTINDLVISGTVKDPDGNDVDVVEITEEAFKDNNDLHSLTILDGVKEIGRDAFSGCSMLESVWLPKTVEYIHPQAFQTCKNLKSIIIDENNPVYMSIYNCIIKIDDKCLIIGCKGSTIPTRTDGSQYLVTSIGEYAFCGSGIQKIEITNNISEIGAHAFDDCTSLTEFTCLESVTQIHQYTFNGCTALTDVVLGDGITAIGQNAFFECTALESIVFPKNLETIGQYAFKGCTSLKEITFNDALTGIDKYAFIGCTALESITLPASILGIGSLAFAGCNKLTSIIYEGTQEQWAKVRTEAGWKPDGVEVTFAADSNENGQDNTGTDKGDTQNPGANAGSGDGGTDN